MAVAIPKDVLSQMSVESVMKTASGANLTVCNFADVEEACEWMKTTS